MQKVVKKKRGKEQWMRMRWRAHDDERWYWMKHLNKTQWKRGAPLPLGSIQNSDELSEAGCCGPVDELEEEWWTDCGYTGEDKSLCSDWSVAWLICVCVCVVGGPIIPNTAAACTNPQSISICLTSAAGNDFSLLSPCANACFLLHQQIPCVYLPVACVWV